MAQLAARYQVHPSQIQAWKKALTPGAAGVLSNGQEQKASSDAALIARNPAVRSTAVRQSVSGSSPTRPTPCETWNRLRHRSSPRWNPSDTGAAAPASPSPQVSVQSRR